MEVSQPDYDVVLLQNVMVKTRDGIGLATDIYRPARQGIPVEHPLPVLLERTPYNKGDAFRFQSKAEYFTRRGYVVVIQDCRGRFQSEGDFYFLTREAEDGYDTVEWIAQQPWCNGKIGTFGTSYAGWTQSALATCNPPHLSAMVVNQAGANAHTSSVRHNGAFEIRFLCWAFWGGAVGKEALANPAIAKALGQVNMREWLTRLPLKKGCSPLSLIPTYEQWAFDIIQHGEYDDYWKQRGLNIEEYYHEHADVPTYYCGGWYDSYTRSTLSNFTELSKIKQQPIRVIMGPWTHGGDTPGLTYAGDADFGPEAAIDFLAFHLRFFDHVLKGMNTGLDKEPPVKIFVMGGGDGKKNSAGRINHGGCWREEQEWPLARTQFTHFYLHADGTLRTEPPEPDIPPSRYQYDPKNPVPTIGGNMSSLAGLMPRPEGAPDIPNTQRERENIGLPGAYHQKEHPRFFGCTPPYLPLASRPDVLVFRTAPLEQDVEVTGPLTVKLWASSSARDTDFTVKLIDSYPPSLDYPEGYDMNISDSIIRARYRQSREKAELLQPGEIYEFSIVLYPTSNLFQKGHRIRLDISSSNFPRFDTNPNTGDPLWSNSCTVVADNKIYHDAKHPSHIILPIIPR